MYVSSHLNSLSSHHIPIDDESSHTSHVLALLTLTPVLLNPAYAALAVYTREILFIEMWAGQLLCEASNWVLKHIIKEERPYYDMGPGYGFPSSHSQWMGYFAAFLVCHFTLRHRFVTTGFGLLDRARSVILYAGIIGCSAAVAFSRYHLTYHSARQVIWGVVIGVIFGTCYYMLVEGVPVRWPDSLPGRVRTALLRNPLSKWLRVRDSWGVYADGGIEPQWLRWNTDWEASQRRAETSKTK
ncbi:hypothetical protein PHLGIDRAFT_112248 [Phlebiopsis gigantea 11061_1 CR5-6]|uniref:Dolichyldiphosphatase n=1 Tax=Phlebiopsis gigantea (strain 11061_1 CR5-6) TaxID=745531 RepID=A0A0C3S064_PHLG1|nr:hypothetical protein PHLGIDRAFT_112248 [Phlebiopsis gigantea 11061_1 CR5-6]